MRGLIEILGCSFLIVAVIVTVTLFWQGIEHGFNGHPYCQSEFRRGEYMVPAYRLGCWLGEVPK